MAKSEEISATHKAVKWPLFIYKNALWISALKTNKWMEENAEEQEKVMGRRVCKLHYDNKYKVYSKYIAYTKWQDIVNII